MSDLLQHHLGRCLSAQQVAIFLQVDISTVYRNYLELGGVKVGSTYKFFEQNLLQALKPHHFKRSSDHVEPDLVSEPKKRRISRSSPEQKIVRKRETVNPHGLL
jgi:hypothetical protein